MLKVRQGITLSFVTMVSSVQVIVGADRVLRNGDVCNKIGTYLKALAAHDNKVGPLGLGGARG